MFIDEYSLWMVESVTEVCSCKEELSLHAVGACTSVAITVFSETC